VSINSEEVQQLRRFERRNGTAADRRENIRLQTSEDLSSVVGGTCTLPVFVPLARDGFEGIVSRDLCGPLTLLFHYGRIDVSRKVTLGFIPRSARRRQPNGRIDADCKGAFPAMRRRCGIIGSKTEVGLSDASDRNL
jgi:hypothetical protein